MSDDLLDVMAPSGGSPLGPLGTADGLPFGPPPEHLADIDGEAAPCPDDLASRIRALAENGRALADGRPEISAACWHEAGRLLDRRAGRPGDAWICHGRALTASSEHGPALDALRRLARRAGDRERLERVSESLVDASTEDATTGRLLSSLGAFELSRGAIEQASDAFREASSARADDALSHLLHLCLVARRTPVSEVAPHMERLIEILPDPEAAAALRLYAALEEERLGRVGGALDRLEGAADRSGANPGELWAAARISLREGRGDLAAFALDRLAEGIDDADARVAIGRIGTAVSALAADDAAEREGRAPAEGTWGIAHLVAASRGDAEEARAAAGRAVGAARSPAIASALGCYEAASLAVGSPTSRSLPEGLDTSGAQGAAAAALAGVEEPYSAAMAASGSDPVADLVAAQREGEAARVADALAGVREEAGAGEDGWAVAVAEAAVRRGLLGRPEEALSVLRGAAERLDRAPLPSLIRAHDRRPESLADLARAESESATDDRERASLLAWAAHHTEAVDLDLARDLHRQALDLDPTCALSLASMERGRSDHAAMARAYDVAAASAEDDRERARHSVRAGLHHAAAGESRSALESFARAWEISAGDGPLWNAILLLAAAHPESAPEGFVDPESAPEGSSTAAMMETGAVAIAVSPEASVKWFERALESRPDDPIAEVGLEEALLASGRWSVVSGNLLQSLRDAGSPLDEARVYQRMASLDLRHAEDASSAILSLMALDERLPGHRPTLGRLAIHFAAQERFGELAPVLAGLARSLADREDAAALAAASWEMTGADLDALRLSVALDPDNALERIELESLTEDPEERRDCLSRIVEILDGSAVHLSRLADAHESLGDHATAMDLRRRALEIRPGDLNDLHGLERSGAATDDAAGLAEAHAGLAAATAVMSYRIEYSLRAAEAFEQVGDTARAASLCLESLKLDPADDRARDMGLALLERIGDQGMIARLHEIRLSAVEDPAERRALFLDLADVRLRINDRAAAKEALGSALEIAPDDIPTHRRLADLHRADGEWPEAIEHLTQAARRISDPAMGVEVFFAMGEIYMDHTDRKDLAEKSFVKVLGWDKGHFAAMERLAALYSSLGNWARAAQAIERLVQLADGLPERVRQMVALAVVLDERLERSKDAEAVLNEAIRVAPLDRRPVEALAALFARQRDAMALNVLLDRALAGHSAALVEEPGRVELYENIASFLTMKTQDSLASLAGAAIRMIDDRAGSGAAAETEASWNVEGRAGDPSVEEFYCPKEVTAGLRETLRAVEEPVSRLLELGAKQMGLSRDRRLDRKHPLVFAMGRLTPGFGLRHEPQLYTDPRPGIRIAPGAPPAVIVPDSVASSGQEMVYRFAAGSALALARSGLSLATLLPEERLRLLVAGLVRLWVPGFGTPGIEERHLAAEADALKQAIPDKVLSHVQQFAFDCGEALEHPGLREGILAIGHRVGLLTAGSLTGAIMGLEAESGAVAEPLGAVPGAGRLVSFAFSKPHIELRRRLGI